MVSPMDKSPVFGNVRIDVTSFKRLDQTERKSVLKALETLKYGDINQEGGIISKLDNNITAKLNPDKYKSNFFDPIYSLFQKVSKFFSQVVYPEDYIDSKSLMQAATTAEDKANLWQNLLKTQSPNELYSKIIESGLTPKDSLFKDSGKATDFAIQFEKTHHISIDDLYSQFYNVDPYKGLQLQWRGASRGGGGIEDQVQFLKMLIGNKEIENKVVQHFFGEYELNIGKELADVSIALKENRPELWSKLMQTELINSKTNDDSIYQLMQKNDLTPSSPLFLDPKTSIPTEFATQFEKNHGVSIKDIYELQKKISTGAKSISIDELKILWKMNANAGDAVSNAQILNTLITNKEKYTDELVDTFIKDVGINPKGGWFWYPNKEPRELFNSLINFRTKLYIQYFFPSPSPPPPSI